ncbi:MAG: hypothetical protein QF437_14460, partial [Planctomycetota bacterium]|nr:hypothetical protein [Planctomycetota bacterium]
SSLCCWILSICVISGLCGQTPSLWHRSVTGESDPTDNFREKTRRAMVDRGLQYLYGIQKEGAVGNSRQKGVSALMLLASLSSGIQPTHPEYGAKLTQTIHWIIKNSPEAFFGGREEPHADHALVALSLIELIGTLSNEKENLKVYDKALKSTAYSLQIQDKGVGGDYFGGWRPNGTTKVNNRMLTAWFLLQLRSAELRGIRVSRSATERAVEFMLASQKTRKGKKPHEIGGFSVDAHGLPVLSTTAAGMAVLSLFDYDESRLELAKDWLSRHRPRWYGPNFYESNFFAIRGLYRSRQRDKGKTFQKYFTRLFQILKERQEPDGAFPIPPGHGNTILGMGKGYSTAMAILILNVDRGYLPMDQ